MIIITIVILLINKKKILCLPFLYKTIHICIVIMIGIDAYNIAILKIIIIIKKKIINNNNKIKNRKKNP